MEGPCCHQYSDITFQCSGLLLSFLFCWHTELEFQPLARSPRIPSGPKYVLFGVVFCNMVLEVQCFVSFLGPMWNWWTSYLLAVKKWRRPLVEVCGYNVSKTGVPSATAWASVHHHRPLPIRSATQANTITLKVRVKQTKKSLAKGDRAPIQEIVARVHGAQASMPQWLSRRTLRTPTSGGEEPPSTDWVTGPVKLSSCPFSLQRSFQISQTVYFCRVYVM